MAITYSYVIAIVKKCTRGVLDFRLNTCFRDVISRSNACTCFYKQLFTVQPNNNLKKDNRPISQTVFMLSIAINRAEHVRATVIIKHNYMLMCNHKIVINIMLCLFNSTGHI